MQKVHKNKAQAPSKSWCLERCSPGIKHCLCRDGKIQAVKKNNIISNWLLENDHSNGKDFNFDETTGCVVAINNQQPTTNN